MREQDIFWLAFRLLVIFMLGTAVYVATAIVISNPGKVVNMEEVLLNAYGGK